jgi:hypothetical protein
MNSELSLDFFGSFLDHPFTPDKFPSKRKRNQIPSLGLKEAVLLLLHGGFPKGISSSLTIR